MKGTVNILIAALYTFFIVYIIMISFIENEFMNYILCLFISIAVVITFYKKIKFQPVSRFLLISTFLLIISIPLSGPKETTSSEKRILASFPEFRISNVWKFFFGFKKYFEDRYAFRNNMLESYAKISLYIWKVSPVTDRVEIGKDDWIFESSPQYLKISSEPLTLNELNLIELNLEIISKWLDNKNIRFYYACIPIKSRIYAENMPPALQYRNSFSRLNQLYDHLIDNHKITIIDVREELMNGKKTMPTYMKTDTHWNEYGAFLAYRKIMNAFKKDFAELEMLNFGDFRIDSVWNEKGDLVMLMGMGSGPGFYEYKLHPVTEIIPEFRDSIVPGFFQNYILKTTNPKSKNKLKILINRDSMTQYFQKFTSLSFSHAVYEWSPELNPTHILKEQPDIVLHEMQELFISHMLKLPAEISSDKIFMDKYFPYYFETYTKVDFSNTIYF